MRREQPTPAITPTLRWRHRAGGDPASAGPAPHAELRASAVGPADAHLVHARPDRVFDAAPKPRRALCVSHAGAAVAASRYVKRNHPCPSMSIAPPPRGPDGWPWPAGNSTRRPPYPHGDPCGWEGFGSTPLPRCPTLLSVRVAHPLNPRPWEFGQSPGSGSGSCTLGLDGPPPGVACYRGGNCPRCLMSAAPHARPLLTRRVRPSSQDGDDAFAYL